MRVILFDILDLKGVICGKRKFDIYILISSVPFWPMLSKRALNALDQLNERRDLKEVNCKKTLIIIIFELG